MTGTDVLAAADACGAFLRQHADGDWTAPVPDLDMTVAEVVAHAAEGPLWYAIDLAAGGPDLPTVEHRVKPDEVTPADLVATLETYARVVAAVVDAAPPTSRGFHPFGPADPAGFAAMACDEMLVHTHDAGTGLVADPPFTPPAPLAAKVLDRLFAGTTGDDDPWTLLLWANGRVALPGRPRREPGWRWRSSPA